MKTSIAIVITFAATLLAAVAQEGRIKTAPTDDMLTPLYYRSAKDNPFRAEVDGFISCSRKEPFHHPLQNQSGQIPRFNAPEVGKFGAGKGPGGDKEHHTGVDFHVGNNESNAVMYAAHEGRVSTVRDAPKYRQYLVITKDVVADNGKTLGKVVTLYAHIDLDLDKADGLSLDGKFVRQGDVVSRHLHSGTLGGPHLHFEIRYYRVGDAGDETFYGFKWPGEQGSVLTEKSAGPWAYGY
jgi:murein DD-endopeptidase MepM/ murein hydrolase activator NlpD